MIKFNLKKKKARRNLHFNINNIIFKTGCDLINNKIQFINKNLSDVLIIDEFCEDCLNKKLINVDKINLTEVINKKTYDCILSNFFLQIPFFTNLETTLNLIFNKLNKDGLFCFNLLTPKSMKTLKNIFLEIDENIYNGSFSRFGPFHDIPIMIENLSKKKFIDTVVSTEYLELNYDSLNKIRSDFREFGIINISRETPLFEREFLNKSKSVFSKIFNKFDHIPVEIEIATFTSWK